MIDLGSKLLVYTKMLNMGVTVNADILRPLVNIAFSLRNRIIPRWWLND